MVVFCLYHSAHSGVVLPLDAQLMAQDEKSLDLSHNEDIFSAAALSFFNFYFGYIFLRIPVNWVFHAVTAYLTPFKNDG